MIINVQGNIIDSRHIYQISEIHYRNGSEFELCFIIKYLGQNNYLEVRCKLFYHSFDYFYLNERLREKGNERYSNRLNYDFKLERLRGDKIIAKLNKTKEKQFREMRENIVKIWLDNKQTEIPTFDI